MAQLEVWEGLAPLQGLNRKGVVDHSVYSPSHIHLSLVSLIFALQRGKLRPKDLMSLAKGCMQQAHADPGPRLCTAL